MRLLVRKKKQGNARLFHYSARHKPKTCSPSQPLFRRKGIQAGEDAAENRGRRRGLVARAGSKCPCVPVAVRARCWFCFFGGVCFGCFLVGLALLLCGVALGAWCCPCVLRGVGLPVVVCVFGSVVAGAWLRVGVVVVGVRSAFSFFAVRCPLVGCVVVVASVAVCWRSSWLLRCGVVRVAVPVGAVCGVACGAFPVGVVGVVVGVGGAACFWSSRLRLLARWLWLAGFFLRERLPSGSWDRSEMPK